MTVSVAPVQIPIVCYVVVVVSDLYYYIEYENKKDTAVFLLAPYKIEIYFIWLL